MAQKYFARQRQSDIFLGDIRGEKSTIPISFKKLKQKAQQQMSPEAYAYIAGSAGSETTKSNNRSGFRHWKIVPRMLRDVSTCKTDITLFNHTYPVPFLLAPIGVL